MDTTLLTTKFYIPAPAPQLIPRARLIQQIAAALRHGRCLVLLAAPPGCGKTTAVLEWVHSPGAAPVAWLALDDEDNNLGRFLTYLIAAVETVRPGAGQQAGVLLRASPEAPAARVILTELLNALATSAQELVLILDDYHVIVDAAIHAAVAFLLERMPAHMHLIITSRADPPLPLARLRAKRQLVELRTADLRFTPDEAAALFNHSYGLDLTAEAIATLARRTEGWVAGLQLAALTLQDQGPAQREARLAAFTGSHRYILDYLTDEVFNAQPAPLQSFLLQTAVLQRMCGPLCTAVTGHPDGHAVLEQLERANLFLVPLDDNRTWYRYHHLFAGFLQQRLIQAVGEDGLAPLHERASAWFEGQGLLSEAVEHALSARAWARVLSLLSTLAAGQEFPDYTLDWQRWVAAIPDAALSREPELALRLAQHLMLLGQSEASQRLLRIAEEVWQTAHTPASAGQVLVVRAGMLLLHADHARAALLARQALEQLTDTDASTQELAAYMLGLSSVFLGDIAAAERALARALRDTAPDSTAVHALGARAALGMTAALRGRLREGITRYEAVIERTAGLPAQQQPSLFAFLGLLHYERNDLAAAETVLRTGAAAGEWSGRIRYWPVLYWGLARVAAARGAWEQADQYLAQAVTMARLLGSPLIVGEAEIWQAQLSLARGDLEAPAAWLAASGLDLGDAVSYERQQAHLLLARIHIALAGQRGGGDLARVIHLLERLLRAAEEAGRVRDVVKILALQAQARALAGDRDPAAQVLVRALALAEPEGYVRTFIDEGAVLVDLLGWPAVQHAAPGYARHLAQAAGTIGALASGADAPGASAGILSAREISVLHLLADGQSLPAIATTLIISVHTARTHVKNIYGKLGVNNRVRALARAHELHIIE